MTTAGPTEPPGAGSRSPDDDSGPLPSAHGAGEGAVVGTNGASRADDGGSAPAVGNGSAPAVVGSAADGGSPDRAGSAVALEDPPRPPPRVAPQPEYGFPKVLWRTMARIPVPPPADPRTWRSPLRGTWLTSVFGALLLVGLPIVILTGLLSYIAYGPQFGQAIPGDVGYLHLPFFDWPSNPSWLYRLTQGLHVTLGMVLPLVREMEAALPERELAAQA